MRKDLFAKEYSSCSIKKRGLVGAVSDVLVIEINGKNRNIKTKNQLLSFLTNKSNRNSRYVVIDEIQKIKNFSEVLIGFKQDYPNRELFITGSNSKIMSNEILQHFQEYGHEIHLNPLSFKEIREEIPQYSIDEYIMYGGLPLIINTEINKREDELKNIYQELYESDVKDKIKNRFVYISKKKIGQILSAIFSTTSEISVKGIASRFSKGLSSSDFDNLELQKEIEETIQILIDSYLIQEFNNDSFNDLNILHNVGLNKKYYCTDNGLLYINCEDLKRKLGIALENAVYLSLTYKGLKPRGKVFLDKKGRKKGEIDFNYHFDDKDYHVQVTYELMNENYPNEVGNLLFFKDQSFKILVYRNDSSTMARDSSVEYIDCESFMLE